LNADPLFKENLCQLKTVYYCLLTQQKELNEEEQMALVLYEILTEVKDDGL
jgi:hypothetical protein